MSTLAVPPGERRPRFGYVLKMYPRFSETFIVNEILAHEAAGLNLEIFSLRPPTDGHFHEAHARVRARVTYLTTRPSAPVFWTDVSEIGNQVPGLWPALKDACGVSVGDVHQAALLASAALERQITHLHAHFGSVATTVARLASHMSGLPYSFTAHAKDIFHESVVAEDLRRKLADATAVITVSEYNARHLHETYGTAAARVHTVYNGLDLEQFTYASPASRPPRVLAVGRLVEKKGFGDLIDACAILTSRGRTFRCEIVGAGPLEADLRAQIDRLGLAGRVELTGPRSGLEVMRHMLNAAVFAAPCVVAEDGNVDGLPTVLLEAMALGTPCVSTDVTGIPEVLRDGVTGVGVPQHDPEALAAAIERLLDDGALRVRLAEKARRQIEARFGIHENAERARTILLLRNTTARSALKEVA